MITPGIDLEQMISDLSIFGLEKIDATVYLGLLQTGPATVGTMAAKLEIERGKAYRALNKLRNLGIISTTFSNPTVVSAVEPAKALTSIIQIKEDEIMTLQKLARKLIEALKNVGRVPEESKNSSFSIVQGRSNIYSRIGKLIHESTELTYIVTPVDDILRMYHTSIPEKIKTCITNGGQIRLLTHSCEENVLPLINRLGASETRIGKLPSKSRMIIQKDKQLIMSGTMNESMDLNDDMDSILHTNSIEMINNMFTLCDHLWKKSKPIIINAK